MLDEDGKPIKGSGLVGEDGKPIDGIQNFQ
jgi:hypothetical protein